jgi:hypothetical protein
VMVGLFIHFLFICSYYCIRYEHGACVNLCTTTLNTQVNYVIIIIIVVIIAINITNIYAVRNFTLCAVHIISFGSYGR